LGPAFDTRIGAIASTISPEKQNVPPFRGGTWISFYAHGENCQPAKWNSKGQDSLVARNVWTR
jgi:hypothetical protein